MMNNIFTQKWEEISKHGHSAGSFRVYPEHLLDLFIGFSSLGEREFRLESSITSFHHNEIPSFENIDIQLLESNSIYCLTMKLTEQGFTDLFSIICNDLAEATSKAKTAEASIRTFVIRLNRWAELMRRRRSQELSFRERLGLLGELKMLEWLIETCSIDAPLAIRGWRGPDGDTNDIGLNNIRIEVKTQLATQRQSLKISSLDQLNWDGRNLYITVNRFSPSNNGDSLASLISKISYELTGNIHGVMEFQRKLILANYDNEASYVDERFKHEELRVYHVNEKFPRLIPNNVPEGIIKANYEISYDVITDFVINTPELEVLING